MRKQRYIHPVTVYLTEDVYREVKSITDREEVSFGEWIRNAIDDALKNKRDNIKTQQNQF